MKIDDWPQPEKTESDISHITVDYNPPSIVCQHCGERKEFTLPMLAAQWIATTDDFTATHRHCKPPNRNS